MTKFSQNWCNDFFDEDFSSAYLVRDLAETVAFLKEKLHLKNGDTLFDQCCGIGNVSIAFAQQGIKTIGVDLIGSYIQQALASRQDLSCQFFLDDACTYTTPMFCDAAINWWTSFGYFSEDHKNMAMLNCVNRSIKKGGWFALDYMNTEERLKPFQTTAVLKTEAIAGSWETHVDAEHQMLVKNWTYRRSDGTIIQKNGGGVKLYTAEDLRRLLQTSGFSEMTFYGSIAGEAFQADSPRCIAIARKTGEAA